MRITESKRITEFFGMNVFNDAAMKKYLSEEEYRAFRDVVEEKKPLDKELAGKIAIAMMEWASQKGATHYSHWFQPLTGTTAEKHDSFISVNKNGEVVMEFTGSNLRKGEADASSFPTGGIRATFEARGYTVWDCSSPAFIKSSGGGAGVLYIPTAFCGYNGEALDKKTPLIRSMRALGEQAMRVLRLLGVDAGRVVVNVGGEQEYFLIDKQDYNKRSDLKFTGRTLFGAMPPKGQEKNDQYYASIRDRVSDFMADVNEELWKLGITAKTQHNEAAPAQHELAPIFCPANLATDQNQLIMETLKKVADKHGLACLLHEKPFAGINGSGKHCNWSLNTDTGINLFKPGTDSAHNLAFLVFFSAVIAAVDEYADLIRMSASSLGNECRLGGNEAPPAIVSVFTGEDIVKLFDDLSKGAVDAGKKQKQTISLGANFLASLSKDTSDRNRTSPFAFTGNKFEFRMVGASATLSTPTLVLNTITAEILSRMADRLEANPDKTEADVIRLATETYNAHARVVFNGNNYSKEWEREARKRGLEVLDNCVDAYEAFTRKKNIDLFVRHGVLSEKEIESRQSIYIDNYIKSANIEAETLLMMTRQEILPAALRWQSELADEIRRVKEISPTMTTVQEKQFSVISELISQLDARVDKLKFARSTASHSKNINKQAFLVRDQIITGMVAIREVIDKLEAAVPRALWPVPTYADILFYN